MIFTVVISEQADKDLRAIYEYIMTSLLSRENADAQLSRLEAHIYNLDNMPKRFPKYKGEIRFMPVDNYLVFYMVDENIKTVSILRVMYGKRDIDSNL